MQRWLLPHDAMIDVGANLGLYSFAACQALRGEGSFLAIDASESLVRNLRISAEFLRLRHISIEQRVVGDSIREITFFTANEGKATCEQSMRPSPETSADYRPCKMQMSTLAEIVSRHQKFARPAAVKVDIEGAETLALRGAPSEWFSDTGPLWLVEINPGALKRNNTSSSEVVSFFSNDSFDCWLLPHFGFLNDARNLPLRPLLPRERFDDAWFYNLIAVPRAARFTQRQRRISSLLKAQ